jgi:predicted HTH transcriptional regulator
MTIISCIGLTGSCVEAGEHFDFIHFRRRSSLNSKQWTFITNHGAVLALVGQSHQITAREIASRLGITERTVLRIIKDLESEGYIERKKAGRANHYTVNRDLPLRRLDQRDGSVAELLEALEYDS